MRLIGSWRQSTGANRLAPGARPTRPMSPWRQSIGAKYLTPSVWLPAACLLPVCPLVQQCWDGYHAGFWCGTGFCIALHQMQYIHTSYTHHTTPYNIKTWHAPVNRSGTRFCTALHQMQYIHHTSYNIKTWHAPVNGGGTRFCTALHQMQYIHHTYIIQHQDLACTCE